MLPEKRSLSQNLCGDKLIISFQMERDYFFILSSVFVLIRIIRKNVAGRGSLTPSETFRTGSETRVRRKILKSVNL
jgi:hypothetical protein